MIDGLVLGVPDGSGAHFWSSGNNSNHYSPVVLCMVTLCQALIDGLVLGVPDSSGVHFFPIGRVHASKIDLGGIL